MEPVIIKPKSDYRPHQSQYPLKQEAFDGITPVFNSLLKAGVIVPCKDSIVHTLIFPVKKVCDESQPDDWRFVKDLKAVNVAVQQRAPSVPNPYTILSQVPQIVNGSLLLFWQMHFSAFKLIKIANIGLHLSLTETVIHLHAYVRAIVNHRPFTTRR